MTLLYMSCKNSNSKKKYLNRKSPPISATSCNVGVIEKGNDNNLYQVVLRKGRGRITKKWAKCFTKGTTCPEEYDLTKAKKVIVKVNKKKKKLQPKKTQKKKKCPKGKKLNLKTNRCNKIK